MSYVLLKLNREEEAKISLSVAMDLEKDLNPIQPNPFLFQLVIKSIFSLLSEAYEKKSKEISLIAKPWWQCEMRIAEFGITEKK